MARTTRDIPGNPFAGRKLFTVQQANAMLPLVRAITIDLQQLAREIVERKQRLAMLQAGRSATSPDIYSAELTQVEESLQNDMARLQDYMQELVDLGVEPKGAVEGLVDFPAVRQGRPIYLCWRLGEDSVQFWHDLESGFAGRQSIAEDSGNTAVES